MLNCVEGLHEIQLKEDDGSLRGFALVYILKTPGQAILNRTTPKKTILIAVDASENHFLKAVSKHLSQKLQACVGQRDGPKVSDNFRAQLFGDQSN